MNRRRSLFLVVSALVLLLSCHRASHELPTVQLLEPADNAVVPLMVRIRALATPSGNISEACLVVDGELIQKQGAGQDSIFTFIWNATAETQGSRHSLAVEVFDDQLRQAQSDSVSVTLGVLSGPTNHNGRVTKDETWSAAGSPHVVGTNLDLEAVVTIEPGAIVEFRPGGRILVGNGALIAQGGSSLITFTGQESVPGFWQSLEFSKQARPGLSVLDNCLIEYGGSGAGGSIVVKSPVRIDNCIIRRSEASGVHVPEGGFLSFSHNTLSNNLNAGLAIDPMLVPTIGEGNSLTDNVPNMVYIIPGKVTADTHWPNLGVPYLLDSML
jgi:hypothetical protein